MTSRHALVALLCPLLAAVALGAGPAPAADVVVQGRIGDVFVGIDTRDGVRHDKHRRGDRHHRRGHRHGGFDPFDPDVSDKDFKKRLERRFTVDKLFRGGSGTFPEDRRRRAFGEEPRPRKSRRDRRRDRVFHGVLLPERHFYYYEDDYYRDEDFYEGSWTGEGAGGGAGMGSAEPAAEPEPPDARGPRFEPARRPGAVPAVGQRLPVGRPHVALDWRDYDLPEPAPGQSYVRFEGAVLLIEDGTRVVLQILWPPAG